MGKVEQPKRLAEKLRRIRLKLDLSQTEMAEALQRQGVKIRRGAIGSYEIKARAPSLLIVLAYSKLARVSMEQIIDDERDLPKGF